MAGRWQLSKPVFAGEHSALRGLPLLQLLLWLLTGSLSSFGQGPRIVAAQDCANFAGKWGVQQNGEMSIQQVNVQDSDSCTVTIYEPNPYDDRTESSTTNATGWVFQWQQPSSGIAYQFLTHMDGTATLTNLAASTSLNLIRTSGPWECEQSTFLGGLCPSNKCGEFTNIGEEFGRCRPLNAPTPSPTPNTIVCDFSPSTDLPGLITSDCQKKSNCETCQLSCEENYFTTATPAFHSLRCLAQDSSIRNYVGADMLGNKTTCSDEGRRRRMNYGQPDTEITFVASSYCGIAPCCPAVPVQQPGCLNVLDQQYAGQCETLLKQGYTCELSFCPKCGTMANMCDMMCGFGLCRTCGDCHRDMRDGPDEPERCDDGNTVDGDGCSSNCTVEEGWTCRDNDMNMYDFEGFLAADAVGPDICETCMDLPGWVDAAGFTCADYAALKACDSRSKPSDALTVGGRKLSTTSYHKYVLAYDIAVTASTSLRMRFKVRAEADAHLFIGVPMVQGYEIQIGGWSNTQSVLRVYTRTDGAEEYVYDLQAPPSWPPAGGKSFRQQFSQSYSRLLDVNMDREFWLEYEHDGSIVVGLVCVDDPDGIVVTLDTDCSQVKFGDEDSWSCDYYSAANFGGFGKYIWELCPLSCMRCDEYAATIQDVYGKHAILGNDPNYNKVHLEAGWQDPDEPTLPTALRQLSVATGWGASGTWDLRIESAAVLPSISNQSNNVTGVDAVKACCVCGRQLVRTPCRVDDADAMAATGVPSVVAAKPTVSPWPVASPWTTGSRRLQARAATLFFKREPQLIGAPTSSGFGLRVLLEGCISGSFEILKSCSLHVIVIPKRAAPMLSLPLERFWPQVRSATCRLQGKDWAAAVGTEIRWQAEYCDLKHDEDYVVVVELKTIFGSELEKVEFHLPTPPLAEVRQLEFTDMDPDPLYAAGMITIMGAANEQDILQYRIYWGRGSNVKVQGELALAAVINTYSSTTSGLRNERSNECIFNDCAWQVERAQTTRRRGRFIIRHEITRECLCYRRQKLGPVTCPVEIVQNDEILVDSRAAYKITLRNGEELMLDITAGTDAPSDCLWTFEDVLIEKVVESRLRNIRFGMCLCEVPRFGLAGADDQYLPRPVGVGARELIMGRYCRSSVFGVNVEGRDLRSNGYCEWTKYAPDPVIDSTTHVDAAELRLRNVVDPGFSPVMGPDGQKAYALSGSGLMTTINMEVPADHTFAFWLNLKGFEPDDPANHPGIVNLVNALNASGAVTPCLLLSQRTRVDDRNPICPDDICNATEVLQCCTSTTTTTTTTTVTTSSTSSTSSSTTGYDENYTNASILNTTTTATTTTTSTTTTTTYPCGCTCVWPPPPEPPGFDPNLPGNKWAVGTEACGSETLWDSGFDVRVPMNGRSGWILVVSVGSGSSDGNGETVYYASEPEKPAKFTVTSKYSCTGIGCLASTFIRDLPRDQQQSCSMRVETILSNCTVGRVEYIALWGGNPLRKRVIRTDCFPGCRRDYLSFPCVHNYGIDDMVGGKGASRAVQVDLQLAENTYVDTLNGTITVTCSRLNLANKNAPPSGALRKVGVAGRTCAGSLITDIGSSVGQGKYNGKEPMTFISQFWLWNRSLSEEELDSLYHGSRSKYYPYHYASFGLNRPGDVTMDAPEVEVSEMLICGDYPKNCDPPYGDRARLRGLPADYAATCSLSVGVAITDFSDISEQIEYIRLIDIRDETNYIEVLTNCWPGKDDAADEIYPCLQNFDISQYVLRNQYMYLGQFDIEIKMTESVDFYLTESNNLLEAHVNVRCKGQTMPDAVSAFAAVDTNLDGSITPGEFEAAGLLPELVLMRDKSLPRDNKLDFKEFEPIPAEESLETINKPNVFLSNMDIFVRSGIFEPRQTFSHQVVPVDTLELMAIASNNQGEGPVRSIDFNDRVNDYIVQPYQVGAVSNFFPAAMNIMTNVMDKTGVYWIHAVREDLAASITDQHIVNGLSPDIDICGGPPGGWPALLSKFSVEGQETFDTLFGCKFELNVPYTVFFYVDRRNPPWGGGTLTKVLAVPQQPGHTKYSIIRRDPERDKLLAEGTDDVPPSMRPFDAVFLDKDPRNKWINGTVTITRAYSEEDFTHYYLFWGYKKEIFPPTWTSFPREIAKVEATGADQYTFDIPSLEFGLPVKGKAPNTLLVFCWNENNTFLKEFDRNNPRLVRPGQLTPDNAQYFNENNHGIHDVSVVFTKPPKIVDREVKKVGLSERYAEYLFDVIIHTVDEPIRVDVAIVKGGTEHLARHTPTYQALDESDRYMDTRDKHGCASMENLYFQESAPPPISLKCVLQPGEKFALVASVTYYTDCHCATPCFCVGEISRLVDLGQDSQVQVSDVGASSDFPAAGLYFTSPDRLPPRVDIACERFKYLGQYGYEEEYSAQNPELWDPQCSGDFSLEPDVKLVEPGGAYPAFAICAACRPGVRRRRRRNDVSPEACVRTDDSLGHRFWRIRVPQGMGHGNCTVPQFNEGEPAEAVRIDQIQFFYLTDSKPDGELLEMGTALFNSSRFIVTDLYDTAGADKTMYFPGGGTHVFAFDDNEDFTYDIQTANMDKDVIIDFGNADLAAYRNVETAMWTNSVPILRARVFYDNIACSAREVYMDWSDDGTNWNQHGWAKTDAKVFDHMLSEPIAYEELTIDVTSYGSNLNPMPKFCHMQNLVVNPGFEQDVDNWVKGAGNIMFGMRQCSSSDFGLTGNPNLEIAQRTKNVACVRTVLADPEDDFFLYQNIDVSNCADAIDKSFLKFDAYAWFWMPETPGPPTPAPPMTELSEEYYVEDYEDDDPSSGFEENIRVMVLFFDEDGNELASSRYDSGPRRPEGKWIPIGLENKVVPAGTRMVQVNFTTWEQKMGVTGLADDFIFRLKNRPHHDVALHIGLEDWHKGVNFPVAWTAEAAHRVPITGLTAGSDYNVHCYSVDYEGNSAVTGPLQATTADVMPPQISVSNVTITDFTATPVVSMTDPGGGYPAITNCFAQIPKWTNKDGGGWIPPPDVALMKTRNQMCNAELNGMPMRIDVAKDSSGKIPMEEVFSARTYLYAQSHAFKQSSWGGSVSQDVFRSCGLRHQGDGRGGCMARGDGLQKAEVRITVEAGEEVHVFIGGRGPGALGYELQLGALHNTVNRLCRGHSSADFNQGLPPPTCFVTSAEADIGHRRRRADRVGRFRKELFEGAGVQLPLSVTQYRAGEYKCVEDGVEQICAGTSSSFLYDVQRGGEVLDPDRNRVFWFSADPATKMIQVGEGDSFKDSVILSYHDPSPILTLDVVYVGAGYRAAGKNPNDGFCNDRKEDGNLTQACIDHRKDRGMYQGGVGQISVTICPRFGNLALGKLADSSDQHEGLPIAFGGTADKMVDGQIGDNTFCEYCHKDDYRHVCAATRKPVHNRPWIRVFIGGKGGYVYGVRLVVPMDSHPGQRHLQVWLGNAKSRMLYLCKDIPDAGGDNFWVCDHYLEQLYESGQENIKLPQVSSASVYGVPSSLAPLPDAFGIRVCELEVYEYHDERAALFTRLSQQRRPMYTGYPDIFTPDQFASYPIMSTRLMPNTHYELFCYAEDMHGNGAFSNVLRLHTTDHVAPAVRMKVARSSRSSLVVDLHVFDPGDAYPVLARCVATNDGLTPQEHDAYFEHRFWKLTLTAPGDNLDEDCKDYVRTRLLDLLGHNGAPLSGYRMYTPGTRLNDERDEYWIYKRPSDPGPTELPIGKPYVVIDVKGEEPLAQRIIDHGGVVHGDMIISITWETIDDLELLINLPPDTVASNWGPLSADGNSTLLGGSFDVAHTGLSCSFGVCKYPVESASFVLATVGSYGLEIIRRDANYTDESFREVYVTVFIRMCNRDYVNTFLMDSETHNTTAGTVVFEGHWGCHRDRKSAKMWRMWQSSVLDPIWPSTTKPPVIPPALPFPQPPARDLWDNHHRTCAETGGLDHLATEDRRPWLRIDLGQYLHVQGIWLAGKITGDRFPGATAHRVDVYVMEANATLEELGFDNITYNNTEGLNMSKELDMGPGEDAREAILKTAALQGGWVQEAFRQEILDTNEYFVDTTIVQRTYDYEATNASSRWFACSLTPSARKGVKDLMCLEADIYPDFEGSIFMMPVIAFRRDEYCGDSIRKVKSYCELPESDAALMNSIYPEAEFSTERAALGFTNLTWTLPPIIAPRPVCALDVPVGDVDQIGDEAEAPEKSLLTKPIMCNELMEGSHVLIVATPHGKSLSLCEVEIFTQPLWTATHAEVQFATSNATDNVCGAQEVKVEYSDNCTNASVGECIWYEAFQFKVLNESLTRQKSNWSWWDRMKLLPFKRIFTKEATQEVEIDKLRENYNYDVFCWATDDLGNDASKYMITLPMPWSDFRLTEQLAAGPSTEIGKRRLAANPFSGSRLGLACTPAVRELIPCEERVVVGDEDPPVILESTMTRMEEEQILLGKSVSSRPTWKSSWQVEAQDLSCADREYYGIKCMLRCVVFDLDAVPITFLLNQGLGCDAKELDRWHEAGVSQCREARWSNGRSLVMNFTGLHGGKEYWITCEARDPVNNLHEWRSSFSVPEPPTPAPTTKQPTLQPTTNPTWNFVSGSTHGNASRPTPYPTPRQTTTEPPTRPPTKPPTWAAWQQAYDDRVNGWLTQAPAQPNQPVATSSPTPRKRTASSPTPRKQTPSPVLAEPVKPTAPPYYSKQYPTPPPSPPPTDLRINLPLGTSVPSEFTVDLQLGTTSSEDAYQLLLPAGASAITEAFRDTIGLGADDHLQMITANARSASRRLTSEDDEGVKEPWMAILRFLVKMAGGGTHAQQIYSRVTALKDGSHGIREVLRVSLQAKLDEKGWALTPTVEGALLDSDEGLSEPKTPSPLYKSLSPSVGSASPQLPSEADSTDTNDGQVTLWQVTLILVLACVICACTAVPVIVVCFCFYSGKTDATPRSTKASPSMVANMASHEDGTSAQVALAASPAHQQHRLQQQRPQQRQQQQVAAQPDGPVVCKVAWRPSSGGTLPVAGGAACQEELSREGTPPSTCSTATGGQGSSLLRGVSSASGGPRAAAVASSAGGSPQPPSSPFRPVAQPPPRSPPAAPGAAGAPRATSPAGSRATKKSTREALL